MMFDRVERVAPLMSCQNSLGGCGQHHAPADRRELADGCDAGLCETRERSLHALIQVTDPRNLMAGHGCACVRRDTAGCSLRREIPFEQGITHLLVTLLRLQQVPVEESRQL